MKKQTLQQRKALRSAAAKKGWETRRVRAAHAAHERGYAVAFERLRREREKTSQTIDALGVADWIAPKPSLWQRIKEWFA